MPRSVETSVKQRKLKLIGVAIAIALVGATCFAIQQALADDSEVIAHSVDSNGKRTNYYNVYAAIEAAEQDESRVIVMDADWYPGNPLFQYENAITINDSKHVTIDMNGHIIKTCMTSRVFHLCEKAHLTLKSSTKKKLSWWGYDYAGKEKGYTAETGGVVWGGVTDGEGGGIWAENNTTLTLDGVIVGGNKAKNGGGVRIDKDAQFNMKNGAAVRGNMATGNGGGVYVNRDDTNVDMNNSFISENNAKSNGGGLYSDADGTRVYMNNDSAFESNYSHNDGGGIYFNYSYFNVVSDDGNAAFKQNTAQSNGGGICTGSTVKTTEGGIKNVTFHSNKANLNGGGLFVHQRYIRTENCTFTSNEAVNNGGGAYSSSFTQYSGYYNCTFTGNYAWWNGGGAALFANNYFENCTVTGNKINEGDLHQGGGVFVVYDHDILLKGKVIIKDNYSISGGAKDDLYLDQMGWNSGSGTLYTSYIYYSVDEGSSIGIRVGSSGDRLIGKQVSSYVEGTYFADEDGYFITHGSDHGGDLWLRKGDVTFPVFVDEVRVGMFKPGDTVTVNGASKDANKVFKCWSKDDTEGLQPFESYVKDVNNQTLTFTMPQNRVVLATEKVDYATNFKVSIASPVAGQAMPSEATLSYTNGGKSGSFTIHGINWLDADGNNVTTAAYGKKYRFYFRITDDKDAGLVWSSSLSSSDVALECTDGTESPGTQDAHVDADNRLNFMSNEFATAIPAIESVEGAGIKVAPGTTQDALKALLPSVAQANVQGNAKVEVGVDTSPSSWPAGLFDGGGTVADPGDESKTYTIGLNLNDSDEATNPTDLQLNVTITVLPSDKVADPVLSPMSGTYTKEGGVNRLGSDNKFHAYASCATDGATIKYTINAGENPTVYTYDPDKGIELTCPTDSQDFFVIKAWAEKNSVKSDEVEADYHLDDTLHKSIVVKSKDTGLNSTWSKELTVIAALGEEVTLTPFNPTSNADDTERVFDHWEWEGAPADVDLSQPTLTIKDFQKAYDGKITAVFTPVVKKIDVDFAAPVAHSELSKEVTYLRVGTSDAEAASLDLTSYLDNKTIIWLPGDSTAKHVTLYTASLPVNLSSLADGVKYKVADSVEVSLGGNPLDKSLAYVASDTSGAQKLYVQLPDTGPYEYKSCAETPQDVEMTFAEAYEYQSEENPSWGLPDMFQVTYECGETDYIEIEWSKPAFDKTKLEAQELEVTGTVKYPSYVSQGEGPESFTVKVKVAAPETAATPTSNPAAGTYTAAQSVELSSDTSDATIYYTTDGEDPTTSSTVYEGDPIEVSTTTTIKAIAVHETMKPSEVATFAYTINAEPEPTPTPTPALVYVTFDSQGGSDVATACILSGEKCPKPDEDPTKAGCTFAGWYMDAACSEGKEFAFDDEGMSEAALSVDTTLYAKWTSVTPAPAPAATYTVSFETNGGSAVADITAEAGSTIEKPEDPTRDGFTFAGWYTDEACTEAWDWEADVVSGDTVLYAKWTEAAADDEEDADTGDDSGAASASYGETKSVDDSDASANKTADTGDELANSPLMGVLTALGLAALAGCVASALYTRRRLREEER